MLTFFIAGLLYLLRFERVDNLGAYSIPSGDRPDLILLTTATEKNKLVVCRWAGAKPTISRMEGRYS